MADEESSPIGMGQPVLVLSEGTERTKGKDAQKSNIQAGKMISDAVRSTLGPKGMDKMLVGSIGDVTITNDGAAILNEMDLEHPAAEMVAEVAETQEEEIGDGTTTAVILAGNLLEKAEDLLEKEVHPTTVASGFIMTAEKAQEYLNEFSKEISVEDEKTLEQVAKTAMTGKKVESNIGTLSKLAVNAVTQVRDETDTGVTVDPDNISLKKQEGGSLEDSKMIDGLVIDKDRSHTGMPRRIENAKIALINSALEVQETEADSEVEVTSPDQLQEFLNHEEEELRDMVNKIKETGANVVFCQKGIDDLAQHFLAKEDIFAIRRTKKSDMNNLQRATGGTIVTKIDDLSSEDLGNAGLLEERKIAGSEMTFVEDCKNPKALTVLIRGGTEHITEEAERSLEDAINVVARSVTNQKILPGGGASEIELSMRLSDYADSVGGKEALAIQAFADSIEEIARSLANNAGLDPIDVTVDLRKKHEDNGVGYGLDVTEGKVKEMFEEGIIEPLSIKTQAISSGSEAATMIIRIDDVIAAEEEEMPAGGPGGAPGGPGGPGGMPGGPGGMPGGLG